MPQPTLPLPEPRQGSGFRRTARLDTATAGVLAASDGELTVGQLTGAVAALLELDDAGRAVARLQAAHAKGRGLLWGYTESGCNAVDAAARYRIGRFGIDAAALRRRAADDLVADVEYAVQEARAAYAGPRAKRTAATASAGACAALMYCSTGA